MPRIVKSVDFERVLRGRSRAATAHFAVHHLQASPQVSAQPRPQPAHTELSTTDGTTGARPVDDLGEGDPKPDRCWLGAVVPKRHARRAVTRSLIKRQIYAVAEQHRDGLALGLWIVRLRAPFDKATFPSAASDALRKGARAELESLFATATGGAKP
jgi:ribonuclease P protein component